MLKIERPQSIRNVSKRIVVRCLAAAGLFLRGNFERFASLYMEILLYNVESISEFDSFLANHIAI